MALLDSRPVAVAASGPAQRAAGRRELQQRLEGRRVALGAAPQRLPRPAGCGCSGPRPLRLDPGAGRRKLLATGLEAALTRHVDDLRQRHGLSSGDLMNGSFEGL